MLLPQSLSRMPESFPGGSLKFCSLFLGREPHWVSRSVPLPGSVPLWETMGEFLMSRAGRVPRSTA